MTETDARLWHPWLRINRVLRAMLHERWSAEAWPQVKAEFILTPESGWTAPRLVLGVSLIVAWVTAWVFIGFAWLKLRSTRPRSRRWR